MAVTMNAGIGPKDDHPPHEAFVGDFSEGLETGLYLALLELIDEGLIITGDEVVLEANSAACRLLERDYRQIAGKPLASLFPDERAFLEARARLFIQGEMRGSLRVALPGGRQRNLRFIAAARIRPGVHALILSPDVIAETYSETRRRTDSLWPRLAAALEQPVIVVDETDTIAAANAVALHSLGRNRASLVGRPANTCLDITWPDSVGPQLAQVRIKDRNSALQARVLPGPKQGWRVLVLPSSGAGPGNGAILRQPRPGNDRILDALLLANGTSVDFDQLEIHFQPLVDTRTGRIRSGEALLRWSHPELGLLPFNRFRHEARERGVLAQMSDWVLRNACVHAAAWPEGDDAPGLTVNVANEQLLGGGLVSAVASAVNASGIRKDRLELDFEEQILNEASEEVMKTLTALRREGVRLAIDDFGQGLAYIPGLKRYPIGAIKLDSTLVSKVGKNEDSEAIVEAIASMATVLGLEILARGVESKAQQAFLTALGCHLQQGPLFGPSMPPAAFQDLLARNAGDRPPA